MKNKLVDLNNHLFEQLERLNDEDLKGKALVEEIERSRAIANVASQIVKNASVILAAQIHMDEFGYEGREKKIPEPLRIDGKSYES